MVSCLGGDGGRTPPRELKEINKDEISDALKRIIGGPEKKNVILFDEKKMLVAYHGKFSCIS